MNELYKQNSPVNLTVLQHFNFRKILSSVLLSTVRDLLIGASQRLEE